MSSTIINDHDGETTSTTTIEKQQNDVVINENDKTNHDDDDAAAAAAAATVDDIDDDNDDNENENNAGDDEIKTPLSAEEKAVRINKAQVEKQKGNEFYGQQRYDDAIECYSAALDAVVNVDDAHGTNYTTTTCFRIL
jgi:tetratricopeptide (TPR) repeat protein